MPIPSWLIMSSWSYVRTKGEERRHTHDSPPDCLCVWDSFELETMFQSFNTMIVRSGSTSDNDLIVYTSALLSMLGGVDVQGT